MILSSFQGDKGSRGKDGVLGVQGHQGKEGPPGLPGPNVCYIRLLYKYTVSKYIKCTKYNTKSYTCF